MLRLVAGASSAPAPLVIVFINFKIIFSIFSILCLPFDLSEDQHEEKECINPGYANHTTLKQLQNFLPREIRLYANYTLH